MLGLLGVIYYLLAIGAIYIGVSQHNGFLGGFSLLAALATALSCAFFGAMCFAADDIRTLLRRIADNLPRGIAVAGEDVATMAPQSPNPTANPQPSTEIDAPSAEDAIISADASSASDEPISAVDACEEEQMAEYDIVHDGVSFLAYGRVRHATLEAAIAYVKSTRGEA